MNVNHNIVYYITDYGKKHHRDIVCSKCGNVTSEETDKFPSVFGVITPIIKECKICSNNAGSYGKEVFKLGILNKNNKLR